ncbi:MAG: OOP family OmpA-OmpF porin [Yoonia sp.]|jgi:OOP family OmpA-OmpF porin
MRLSAIFTRLAVFAVAAGVCFASARTAAIFIEERSVVGVREVLIDQGHEWASVISDGLQVVLEGQAPSEAVRFRAISAAGSIVGATRVIDNMNVIDSRSIAPPEFAIEILRNDSGVSLIGLIPANTDRETLAAQIARIANGQNVTDLLEIADYPVPPTWQPALNYALRALSDLPRSKISVSAKRVLVNAITDSELEKAELESNLSRNKPANVQITVALTAPRPVISPFTTRFYINEDGARFDACAVDGPETEAKILIAAREAGFTGNAGCTDALGVPSRTWGEAVSLSIKAVSELGGGTVTISDTDISLVAPQGTAQATFDRVVGQLENALPPVYALASDLPRAPTDPSAGPPQFTITRSPEGAVQLRGRVPDELTNTTAENYAAAKFGLANVTMGTRVVDELPSGWVVRVLAGIEVMSQLSNGSVIVEPTGVTVRGKTGNETAQADISRLLIDKLGQAAEFDIDIEYVKELDPIAGLPTPEECVAKITEVTAVRKITFDPSASSITSDTTAVVNEIADILKRCPDLRIEIAGYTDSQGREIMNEQLSQERATAVLDALRARRVPVSSFAAKGYGEADPIADNGTAEGREANRRIEFRLIVPETAPEEPTALEEAEAPAAE